MKQFEISKSELFRHPKFGNLRVLTDEKGDPWFVGKVVAEALGYKIPQKAISDHVHSSDRKMLRYKAFSKTGKAYSNDLIVLVEKRPRSNMDS